MKLTDAKVKASKLSENKTIEKMSDGAGLYLQITASAKYWRLNYRFAGKQKTLSIGVYPFVSLKEARAKATIAKKQLEQNIDPSYIKKEEKRQTIIDSESCTFKAVSEEWMKKKSSLWVQTTLKHKRAELDNHVLPWLGDIKLDNIHPIDILSVCLRVESNGHHEQAHRVKMLCSQIMRYGVATGRILLDPARDIQGALAPVVTTHRPCIKDPESFGALLRAIDAHIGTFVVRCALMLSPLVFLRPVELRKLEWKEINFETKTITIPEHKMKMKIIHIVPLCTQAITLLKSIQPLTGQHQYVFPSARSNLRPMSDGAINATLRRLGYDTKTEHCAHGFRGTASTLLHELGYNSDIIERQLAHKEGNSIKAAYNHARHLPERTILMQEWADYLEKLKTTPLR